MGQVHKITNNPRQILVHILNNLKDIVLQYTKVSVNIIRLNIHIIE